MNTYILNFNLDCMKTRMLFILISILNFYYVFAQNIDSSSTDSVFKHLNKQHISTGILIDKVHSWSNIQLYDGLNDTICTPGKWRQMYHDMYNASMTQPTISHIKDLNASVRDFKKANNDAIPILIMNFNYNKFKDNAFTDSLVIIENYKLYDAPNRTEIPYLDKRFFASTVFIDKLGSNQVRFYVGKDFYFTNDNAQPLSVEIDFDDGNGYRTIAWGSITSINYPNINNKHLKVKVNFSTKVLTSASKISSYSCTAPYTPDLPPWGAADPTYKWKITADISYLGSVATGNAYVKYRNGSTQNMFAKPFILVEGIDFSDDHEPTRNGDLGFCGIFGGTDPDYSFLSKYPDLIEALRTNGYDIILLDFYDGADYIQRNSMLLVKLIQLVNSYKLSGEPIIVSGASMGGQIARFALAYMESTNMPHCSRMYVSMDSPHRGANIPLGLQHMIKFYAEEGHVEKSINIFNNVLDRPAAKQLLVYQVVPGGISDFRSTYLSDLNSFGYPNNVRKIAIANGTQNSVGLNFNPGDKLLDFSYSLPYCLNAVVADAQVWSLKNYGSVIFHGKIPKNGLWSVIPCIAMGIGSPQGPLLCNLCINSNITFATKTIATGFTPLHYDNAPGSMRNTIKYTADELNEEYPNTAVAIHENHTFVPTASALDINTNDLFLNISNSDILANKLTPFDNYYAPLNTNEYHVEATGNNIAFILDEVLAGESNLGNILTADYNFGNPKRWLLSDVSVRGGHLYINAAKNTDYGTGTTPTNGSTFTARTYECGSTVEIKWGGSLTLGDIVTNNKAVLEVEPGSILIIGDKDHYNNAAYLNVNSYSKLLIKKGGSLVIYSQANVNIKNNASIYIEDGAYLCVENNANINLEGGTFLLENGAIKGINPALGISANCINFDEIKITRNGNFNGSCFHTYNINAGSGLTLNPGSSGIITWDGNTNSEYQNYKIRGKIEIENATLIIKNSSIHFADSKSEGIYNGFVIHRGAKLIVDNSTITGVEGIYGCQAMWDGIQVWGSNNIAHSTFTQIYSGNHPHHGVLILKNESVIENAYMAIKPYQETDGTLYLTHTGGIVLSNNTTFRNNQQVIDFAPFEHKNQTKFINCIFEITDKLIDSNKDYKSFINIFYNQGIRFEGNMFRITAPTSKVPIDKRIIGIESLNSQYIVGYDESTNATGSISLSNTTNQFIGLKYGIDALSSNNEPGTNTLQINGNIFQDVPRSILLQGVEYATVSNNQFEVAVPISNANYGLYLNGCNGYKVEGNRFKSFSNTSSSIQYGIIVHNSGSSPNEIYRNDFNAIVEGIQSQQNNNGLQIKCNNFTNTINNNIVVTSGYLADQGECVLQQSSPKYYTAPAGNRFSDNCGFPTDLHIANYGGYFEYNAHDSRYYVPDCYYNSTLTVNTCDASFDINKSCLSTLSKRCTAWPSCMIIDIANIKADVALLINKIDKGHTGQLLNQIHADLQPGKLKDTLMTASPFLSDKIILAVINEKPTPLPYGNLKDILIANSPLTAEVMNVVHQYSPALPNGMIKEIEDAQIGVSARKLLEKEILILESNIHLQANEIVRYYLMTEAPDSAVMLLEQINTIKAKCDLVDICMKNKQLTKSEHYLNELTIQQKADDELTNFVKERRVRLALVQANKKEPDMDAIQQHQIREVANSNTRIEARGKSTLTAAFNEQYPEIIESIIPNTSLKTNNSENTNTEANNDTISNALSDYLYIAINPLKQSVIINYSLSEQGENTEILIWDMFGRKIKTIKLNEEQIGKITLSTGSISPGVYLAQLVGNNIVETSVKFVIIK